MPPCNRCVGKGYIRCRICDGSGKHPNTWSHQDEPCTNCSGSGTVRCPICDGSGIVTVR